MGQLNYNVRKGFSALNSFNEPQRIVCPIGFFLIKGKKKICHTFNHIYCKILKFFNNLTVNLDIS